MRRCSAAGAASRSFDQDHCPDLRGLRQSAATCTPGKQLQSGPLPRLEGIETSFDHFK
ncbi:MAG: hypothetical protein ACOCU6_01965 [Nanoarchaeota archaeon]